MGGGGPWGWGEVGNINLEAEPKIYDRNVWLVVVQKGEGNLKTLIDGRGSGHLGPTVGLKTLSIHVCICPHFGM